MHLKRPSLPLIILMAAVFLFGNMSLLRVSPKERPRSPQRTDGEPCCAQELEQIRAAEVFPIPRQYAARAFIDTSSYGTGTMSAGLRQCEKRPASGVTDCDIYVAQKLMDAMNRDELMGILAHEMGHIAHEHYYLPLKGVELEYQADEFAMNTLRRLGIERQTLLDVILRIRRTENFNNPEAEDWIRRRVQRMRGMLGETAP